MLHLVFQSSPDTAVIERMTDDDAAVFLGSAVLGVLQKGKLAKVLSEKLGSNRFYALSEDMVVRGILETELVSGLEVIDYSGLVKLTVAYPSIASWC